MKLSVLVTFYNQSDFVFDCLNSIVSQKVNFDFEVLIGDDGSTDGTRDQIQIFLDKYPGKFGLFVMPRDGSQRQNKFQRAAYNRTNLIKRASGEYLTICDGDDYYTDENKLQLQVDALDANKGCIGCAHDVEYWIQKEQRVRPFPSVGLEEGIVLPTRYLRNPVPFCTMALMWRNVFKHRIPAVMPERYFDDYCITIYMLNFGSLFYIRKIMAHYRILDSSLWSGATIPEKLFEALVRECVSLNINRKYSLYIRKKYAAFNIEAFDGRSILCNLPPEEANYYRGIASDVNASHLLTLLDWKEAGYFRKARVYARYLCYRAIRKYL